MLCSKCGYMMDAFDKKCPRCHGRGVPTAAQVTPPPLPHPSVAPPPLLTPNSPVPTVGCLPLFGGMVLSVLGAALISIILGPLIWCFIWLISCGAVLVDARQIGVRKGIVGRLGDMNPWGWFFACLLLWAVAFPAYLIYRPYFVAANQ